MIRLRIQVSHRLGRWLVLTDTPHPDCRECEGDGGIEYPYGDDDGEYAGSNWEPCGCWNENHRWRLLPLPRLPRLLRRRGRDPWGPHGYSNEPPF
ncbi:hypothetical protein [Streptomyces pseudovenezuelae]|uniref:Uncharacterized protein n=1 Tax=Streptomyces pseudovenezuelae TaxID=67350 RepID=A0ABT6LMT3_9ACTN|nr:hypothetical protein [Streptomyces pseudovenezuelae]MDH6217620.1 hypothetical protein [Streptomyces pseudovenezuelae]